MNMLTKLLAGGFLILIFWLWWVMDDYDKLSKDYSTATNQLSQQVEINKDYQARITRLNQLDIRHSQELASAKNEIDSLRDAVRSGSKRVYVKAECPKSTSNPTSGVANATTARPTDTAIRNYWLLRERIAESEQVILGLQDYIRTECVN
ncbi:lysis protein [Proteus vulgaris]|uniref:lysis protein n=1 Tax=Proteus vulgaris TaxID=585 RepID=UPI00254049A4|nr:lysis protein [Proteus vulgaris]WIF71384.1 lysis protein [Proteus vulgaris]